MQQFTRSEIVQLVSVVVMVNYNADMGAKQIVMVTPSVKVILVSFFDFMS